MAYWTPQKEKSQSEEWFTPSSYSDKKKERTDRDKKIVEGKLDLEHLRRRGFQEALRGKPLDDLLTENDEFYRNQNEISKTIAKEKKAPISESLEGIGAKIEVLKAQLKDKNEIHADLIKEKDTVRIELSELEISLPKLIEELEKAQQDLIKNRLKEVQGELKDLVDLYNNIYDQKLGKTNELNEAVETRRKTYKALIKENESALEKVNKTLSDIYKFGNSLQSAKFLIFVGLIAAMTAGWFFTVFSSSNDIESQNWMFFALNNLFNYLSLYVVEYTPLYAAGVMILYLLALLSIISLLIIIIEITLNTFSNDESNYNLNMTMTPKKKFSIKFNITANSTLSLWLKLLPWIFISAIILILISVGMYNGGEQSQISYFSKNLSGQAMGFTFALLFSGITFLYITKVIEPRKTKDSPLENEKITRNNGRSKKKNNLELISLVIAANVLLLILVASQSVNGFTANKSSLLSLICFIVMANLTAFILGYGLRQRSLFSNQNLLERKIAFLNDRLTEISGSKPMLAWNGESRNFKHHFLIIQRDLFNLIHDKTSAINYVKIKQENIFKKNDNTEHFRLFGMKLWKRKTSDFYNHNFPKISYQIREKNIRLNALNQELKILNEKITTFSENRSEYEKNISNELDRLNQSKNDQLKAISDIEVELQEELKQSEKRRVMCAQEFTEGHGLGLWTKQTLNRDYENEE